MTSMPLEHRRQPPAEAATRAPAAIVLHGRGADESDLLGVADRFPSEMDVISLRAPTPLGPGYTWYDLDLSAGGLQSSQPDGDDLAETRDLVDRCVEVAIEEFGLDSDRIGLFGFSQGAVVGMASILERPDLYRWVAAHHGYLPASHHDVDRFDAGERSAFLAGGELDEVIPFERAAEAAERLEAAGLDVTIQRYPTGHGIGPQELADVLDWLEDRY